MTILKVILRIAKYYFGFFWIIEITSYYCSMKEKKKIIKESSGSVKVEPSVLIDVTNYCKENGIKVTFFATEALKERLLKEKSK